jgi:serine protease Do
MFTKSPIAIAIAFATLSISARAIVRADERLLIADLKDGTAVRGAFREVVAQVNRSVVAVLVNGRRVSLGAIVSGDGYVLTKASELGEQLRCRLHDGREFDATLIGSHDRYDVALLKIEAIGLTPLEWAEARDPQVGQWLATAGMEDVPAAVGIVSVPRRAIPPERGVLGVQLSEGSPGPRVIHVVPSSAAARAGLKTGDLIIRAAEQRVENPSSFDLVLHKLAPGDTVNVVILRSGRELALRAVLGRVSGNQVNRGYMMNRMSGRMSQRRAGFPQAIQHDTVLEPEMCGGPVVDLSGRAIGINIARAGRVETYAVPAEVAQTLVRELHSGKELLPEPPAKGETPPTGKDDLLTVPPEPAKPIAK